MHFFMQKLRMSLIYSIHSFQIFTKCKKNRLHVVDTETTVYWEHTVENGKVEVGKAVILSKM